MTQRTKDKILANISGFTFIELMVVVAVIGILSGLFVTQYPASQRRARDVNRRSDIKQYQTALEAYANRNNGNYFAANGNVADSSICSTILGLAVCPDDPDTSLHYRIISSTSEYVLWAEMEQPPDGDTHYFVVCSTGRSGVTTSEPSGTSCPGSGWI